MAFVAPLAAATAVIGGTIGAFGAIKEGEAKEAAANQNAAIAGYNRDVSKRNEAIVLSQSRADALDADKQLTRNLSTIRAAYGANGLALQGSPLDVINDTANEKSLDTSKTLYKGKVQAAGYEDEANNYAMKQQLYKNEAEAAPGLAQLSAAGQFFGGISKGVGMFK